LRFFDELFWEMAIPPGASVARVHGVNANQVFAWRRLYRQGLLERVNGRAARLLPVQVSLPKTSFAVKSLHLRAPVDNLSRSCRVYSFGYVIVSAHGSFCKQKFWPSAINSWCYSAPVAAISCSSAGLTASSGFGSRVCGRIGDLRCSS
jgi:transposase-like protein